MSSAVAGGECLPLSYYATAAITLVTNVLLQLLNVTRMLNLDLNGHRELCETIVTIWPEQLAITNTTSVA